MKLPKMKFPRAKMLACLGACAALAFLSPSIQAEETVLFDGEQTPFDKTAGGAFELWANVTGNTGFDAGGNSALLTDYGITLVDAVSSPFGTGNAMRIFDLAPDEKPELQGEFGAFDMADPPVFTSAPLLEPFRVDIDFNNRDVYVPADENDTDGNHAIRLRMANSLASITSETRSAFSISFGADGRVSAKYSGLADNDGADPPVHTPDPNDADTLFSDVVTGPSTMTMVANGATSGQHTYTLFGQTRTLDPLHYDIYINGVLLNTHPENPLTDVENAQVTDRQNGLQFHTERSFGNYIPANGLGRIGLIGSSNSDTLPDYDMDNIVVRTGDDIEASAVVVGDFDGDGDVDCDDLDGYVGNIGAAAAGPLAALDIDGNGTLSAADANTHITTLVVTSNGQTGTFPGDLNCDGSVNVLGDAFALISNLNNAATMYSQGDINFDGTVNVLGDAFALIGNLGNTNNP